MKNIIERIAGGAKIARYLPKAVSTRLVVAALAVFAAAGVWAAVPVPTAVWESGQFADAANLHGGYSISLNGNTINEGGNIVIKSDASAGVTIDVTDVLGNAGRDMSVLIKYSNATAPTSQAVFTCVLNDNNGTYDTGFISSDNNAGTLVGYYNKTSPYTLKNSGVNKYPNPASTGSGCFLYSYKNATGDGVTKGVYGYNGTTIATLDGGSNDGLCWPGRRLHKIAIGGPSGSIANTYAVWPNLIIEKVAIFVGNAYSNADIAGYRWPSEIKAVLPDRDMINLNISNADGYAITGSGVDTITTLAGEMLDNAWQNTPSGNAVVSGDPRNGRVTGVTAYDGTSKEATTLSDVTFTWAVEGPGTANYGNVAIENNPTFHKAWLARLNKAVETSSILVQSIPYRKYDIIVYCFGADDSAFNPVFVNGVPYVGDTSLATDTKTRKATSSSETWGGRRASPSLGQTAIMLKGLENPELSLTIRSGVTSICAVQILRDMSEGVWPTSKKVISLNLMSAKSSSGTTPAIYGLEPVPDAAWTKDGLSTISSSGTDVSATIMEWNGSSAVEASGVTVNEKAANAHNWSGYSYTPQNQILSGYLDDTSRQISVTVTSVPYAVYDVIVYTATDTENYQFGPVTVNGVPYRWDDESGETVVADSADSTATTRWGASRSRLPAYGRNAIRIPDQTASTLTITGANNDNEARGGIAAIQIVEAHSGAQVYSNGSWSGGAEPTSGDAVIVLDGDTALPIDGTASLDTVTIIGTGTLTLSGSGKFTATTIEVNSLATVNVDTDRLDATTYVGSGTVVYTGRAPETGKGWTDSANWTGTVEVRDHDFGANIKLADYGNMESTVCMNGSQAYLSLDNGAQNIKELKIGSGGFTQAGPYADGAIKDFRIPAKLTGIGTYTVYMTGNATKTIYFIGDVSEFSGKIAFNASTESSRVVMGSETDRGFANKSLVVGDGVTLNIVTDYDGTNIEVLYVDQGGMVDTTINASSSYLAAKSFVVDGILKTEGVDSSRFRNIGPSPAVVAIGDTGELVLYGSSSDNNNFSKVTGTGTIRYAGTSWRSFPDSNPFADTLTVAVYQADGIAYSGSNDSTKTIGSIFGTKNLRTDLGGSNKTLIIKQAKDGEWGGVFSGGGNNPDRLSTFVVQPGSSAAGTLKLSGAQTQSNDIQIDAGAKVNLTGTWVGAATVSGTFGGTGTLTGNLTFSDGATFKTFSTDSDGLSVSGAVTFPTTDGESVTVDLTGVTLDPDGTTLITANSINSVSKLASTRGVLIQESNVLKAYPVASLTKADGSSVPYDSISEAMVGAHLNPTYQYVTVYAASPTEVTLLLETTKLKVVGDSSLVTIVARSAEYSYSAGSPVEGVTTYTLTANPTTYTWSHSGSSYAWSSQWNWRFGDNVQAERYPMAGDSVVFPDGAAVTLDANADCAAMTVNGAVAISGNYGLNVSGNVTGGTGAPVLSISSADLNLSALSSVSGVALVLADSAATVLATTGATLAAVPTTTVEDSYVKTTLNVGATTYSVAAKTVVTVSVGANVSLTIDGNAVTDGATLKFTPGDSFTYAATPAANYTANVAVTGGTDNDGTVTVGETAITVAATATCNGATVSNVSVSYGADYASATVTATVSDTTLDYYISWGNGEPVKGTTVSGSTVTFDVSGIAHTEPYQSSGYNISAKDGETTVTTTGGSGTTVAADTTPWFSQSSANSGAPVNGSWATAVNLTEPATVEDNTFTATAESTSSRVVLEFNVCFSATNADDVSGEAQAAIKLGEVDSATTFMVLTNANEWAAISNAALTPNASETNKVVLTIDYGSNTYGVTVNGHVMKDAANSESFPLAASKTSVQTIDFAGSGTLKSMKGDQVEGYMVVDKNGTRYATISDAIAAYTADPTIGPLKVLHAGTPPSGWSIVSQGGIDILKKLAKGFFFMAY